MRLFLFCLCILCGDVALAQTGSRIRGKIIDSASHQPVEYATISVSDPATRKIVNGALSDTNGVFEIAGLAAGTYNLSAESIDYNKSTIDNITVAGNKSTKDIGTILLSSSRRVLKGVTVTASAPIIENKVDKIVYNAANDITSQGGQALDVLKKVPQVNVDIDGNVELQGNPNIRFLINGKPSSVFGSSITDALASIPASQIKSIEVITTPGARYDAQGTGGIINIVLKESKMQGFNGTVNLSGGTRLENGSVNLNFRRNHFGVNVYFSGNAQLASRTPTTQDRTSFDSLTHSSDYLTQTGYTDFQRHGYQSGASLDWDITKNDNITAGLSYNHFDNTSKAVINVSEDTSGSSMATNSIRNSDNHFKNGSVDWSAGYRKKFHTEGEELNILYNASLGQPDAYYQQASVLSGATLPYAGSESNDPGRNVENDFSMDFTKPLKGHFVLDAGAKVTLQDIRSSAIVNELQPASDEYLPAFDQSYDLKYHSQVYAAYLSSSFPVGSLFKVSAGARYEYTAVRIEYPNSSIAPYSIVVPTLILSHDLQNAQFIKLAYTRRIERADYRDVNPFPNIADPYNISIGNPTLKPEIGNNMELGYNKSFGRGSNFYVALIERINTQDHKPLTTFYPTYAIGDSVYTNVSVTAPQNLGTEYNSGINVSGSWTIKDKLSFRGNVFFSHRHSVGLPSGSNIADGNRFRTNMNASYQFPHNFIAEAYGNYNAATNNIQGRTPQSITYTVACGKQFWNKKASIGLTATNLFNKYTRQVITVQSAGYTSYMLRELPYRSVGISCTYSFGKLEFKKTKDSDLYQNNPPAMDN